MPSLVFFFGSSPSSSQSQIAFLNKNWGANISVLKKTLKKIYNDYFRLEKNRGSLSVHDHVVVFDSDDWGCQRVRSEKQRAFLESDPNFHPRDIFENGDSLETKQDFESLSHVLKAFSDSSGRHPNFTLNYVLNNLVFSEDQNASETFDSFRFESVEQTYLRCGVPLLWKKDDGEKWDSVFSFSLHAFAHLNQTRFREDVIQKKNGAELFYRNGIVASEDPHNIFCYMDELGGGEEGLSNEKSSLEKSAQQFKELFGFSSICYAPSCGVISPSLLSAFAPLGFRFLKISDSFYRSFDGHKFHKHSFHIGETIGKSSCRFLIRNCNFEPIFSKKEAVAMCLRDIEFAFRANKPAVISTHRMNYVEGFTPRNAQEHLKMLSELLAAILKRYPDVKFMSTDEMIARYFK
jgi:hypothetical protein